MSGPVKHLLVYADGRVEETEQPLVGIKFLKLENVDGEWWLRMFTIQAAYQPADKGDGLKVCTMVALERGFERRHTREDVARMDAERRAETMKRALWGVMNYPADEGDL